MEKLKFDVIYKDNYYPVLYFINGNIRNLEVSKELTNDVFLKVSEHLNVFNPEKSKLITWIFNIAKNKVIDYYRTNNNTKKMNIGELNDVSENFAIENKAYSGHSTDGNYDRKELNKSIMAAISNLKENSRKVAELYFIHEKQYNEIAEILDISMSNVKVTILRAREVLQKSLKKEYAMM